MRAEQSPHAVAAALGAIAAFGYAVAVPVVNACCTAISIVQAPGIGDAAAQACKQYRGAGVIVCQEGIVKVAWSVSMI